MSMPEEDHVDVRHLLGDELRRVLDRQFGPVGRSAALAGVRAHDDDVGALGLLITGTQRLAVSTRSGTSTLPDTLALSQMTTPGFVSPSTPTLTGGCPFATFSCVMVYGV